MSEVASPLGIDASPPSEVVDRREAERLAREVVLGHKRGLQKRRHRDLTAEKYLIHIDGEGDNQWADVINGSRVGLPVSLGQGLRLQYNLLRPLVENAVAYHTAQPFQVMARARGDQVSRDAAKIDTIFANDILRRQKVNAVIAEALFFASAYGSCPVHGMWRDDFVSEPYHPLYQETGMRPGWVDIFCGDPWDTVYNDGATRHSVQWASYGRVLPAKMVRGAFQHVEGIDSLKGVENLPSASRFQRISRRWSNVNAQVHGTAAMGSSFGGDELIALVCREIAPGVVPEYPQGRLQIVALDGQGEASEGLTNVGAPVLLHDGPLPGGRFSFVRFYMGFRGDDVLGKPYVADIDDLQMTLNQLVTLEVEYIRRFARPPLKTLAGTLVDDTITTEDDALLEFTDPAALQYTGYLYPPSGARSPYGEVIERVQQAMFRLGGWQAASRGESQPGDPAAKVIALARADDSIFGPVNQNIKNSAVELLQLCHALARQYMDVPWLVGNVTGEDMGHLAQPYISREELSHTTPDFEVVSGQGATTDAQAQRLFQLVTAKSADGKPLMSVDLFWRLFPDQTIRPPEVSADYIREARATHINYQIRALTDEYKREYGEQYTQMIEQAHEELSRAYRIRMDDPPKLHIEMLSQITQDETEDQFARGLAEMRQDLYRQMEQQQMMQQAMQQQPQQAQARPAPRQQAGQQQQQQAPPRPVRNQPVVGNSPQAREMQMAAQQTGQSLGQEVRALTQSVGAGI